MKDNPSDQQGSRPAGWLHRPPSSTFFQPRDPTCNRTWDGWLCWDDTKAGVISEQHCPDYFQDFDPSG
uniref:G-protein coupled receptors family 2 profile 1 domain-containing protein n=1 Tax=Hippocampus comes TaxID=109280 RepID=A0A3Q3DVR9_HIPCM